uniref:Large ribosomal subunit protein uL24c n=1 Tax=Dasyclonium flaccidum TaxID=2007274 RepID=A0A1Z1ML67_9FLOR|nr:ribosomal protein L24 [Dasyclonium flaccidum]ARW66676.1 ribosomal protein L24 [Dasyclonium flaccidum]
MIKNKSKIKKGDNVKVISGKCKGQTGKVIKIMSKKNYLIIDNINLKTKHLKPKSTEEKGKIEKVEGPIHYSNVKIINNIEQ